MLGELPVEAKLHISTLTLFHNLWSNPDITLHGLVKYIMMMSSESSLTWSNHVNLLCRKYSLPCPLLMLQGGQAWPKEEWKCLVKTRITSWYEKELRLQAIPNSKMNFLNVQLTGLSGQPHPALHNIRTTQDSKKLRLHLKFLCGDLLTGWRKSRNLPGTDPTCSLCTSAVETIEHIIAVCPALSEVRQRIYPELVNTVASVQPTCRILISSTPAILTQFLLDCTSINLPEEFRIPARNPKCQLICKISRDWCFSISNSRSRQLKKLLKDNQKTLDK